MHLDTEKNAHLLIRCSSATLQEDKQSSNKRNVSPMYEATVVKNKNTNPRNPIQGFGAGY